MLDMHCKNAHDTRPLKTLRRLELLHGLRGPASVSVCADANRAKGREVMEEKGRKTCQ